MKTQKFIPLLVIAAGAWAYFGSFRDGFMFDDVLHILENPRIRQLWPPWEVFTHSSRPVVLLSLAVNYALGGIAPWGYHVFNVGIHILAALTLYGVVRLTLASEALRSRFGGAAPWLAGATSLIWLVHPLQTESVTYTIQRGESLMGLFYLLTLYCVIRSNDASRGDLWKVSAVVSCALGMACKPVMVTAPFVILLYDRAFLVTSWREAMQRRAWLYAGLAATGLLLPLLLANAPLEWKSSAGFEYKGIPPFQYARMQSVVVLHYLRLTFWPRPLCLDYGWQYDGPEVRKAGDALPELIVVGALLAGTVWAWRRKPALGFLGAWFFIILAPTSSFMPIADPIVEHRMYLPLAGVVAMVIVGTFVLGKRLLSTSQGRVLGWVAGGSVVLLLANLTIQRNRDYISELTIWQDTVVKCPQNPRARSNLGRALFQLGRLQEAIGQHEQAVRIKPDFAEAHYNLGQALFQAGRVSEAVEHFEQALRIRPDFAQAHYSLGQARFLAGKVSEAVEHFEQALRLKPDYAEAHCNLGQALARLGRLQEAIDQHEQALRLEPDYAQAHNDLGVALLQAGRFAEGIGQYEQALRLKPDYAEAHYNLGLALARLGRPQEGIGQYEQALRLKPDYAEAHVELGIALSQLGKIEEAIAHYEQALRLKPDYAEARNDLGVALSQAGRSAEGIGQYEQALRLKPDYAEAHVNLGIALSQLGSNQDALAHFMDALRLRPDSPEVHYNLGQARFQAGQVREAIAQYEEALRLKPDYAEAHYALGMALEPASRVREAVEHYQQALRIKPDFTQVRKALARLQAGQ